MQNLAELRVLVVSFAFPPLSFPRSVQVARLLRAAKGRFTVVCADDELAGHDNSIEPAAEAALARCLRVPHRLPKWRRNGYFGARRLKLPGRDLMDPHEPWFEPVMSTLTPMIDNGELEADLLVTFGQPWVGHDIGLTLQAKLKVPWIAHFSDPWVDNPYAGTDALSQRHHRQREAAVVDAADRLIFTSSETSRLVMKKYPPALAEKATVLPHCFDPNAYSAPAPAADRPFCIRSLGHFYGIRTPEPVLSALIDISQQQPDLLEDVRFEFYGSCPDSMQIGTGFLPPELVTFYPSVGHHESQRLMVDTDALLLIDAPADESVFLPSKLIEYVGANKPIIGITPPGTSAALLSRLGAPIADPRDNTAVRELWMRLLADREGLLKEPLADVRAEFTMAAVAAQFDQIVQEVLAAQP